MNESDVHNELNFDPLTPGGPPQDPNDLAISEERPPTPSEGPLIPNEPKKPPPTLKENPKQHGLPLPLLTTFKQESNRSKRKLLKYRTTRDRTTYDDELEIVGTYNPPVFASLFRGEPKRKRNNLKTVSQLLSNIDTHYFFTFGTRIPGQTEIINVSNSPGKSEHLVRSGLFSNVTFVENSPQLEKDVFLHVNDVHLVEKLAEDYRSVPRSSHATFEDFLMSITRKKDGDINKTLRHIFMMSDIFVKSNGEEEVPKYFDVD